MITEAPIRPLAAIGVIQLKMDSTLNVKGRYARGFITLRRYLFTKLYRRCRLRGFERTFCVRRCPFPRKRRFNIFGLIRLFVGASDSVALTASWRNRLHRYITSGSLDPDSTFSTSTADSIVCPCYSP